MCYLLTRQQAQLLIYRFINLTAAELYIHASRHACNLTNSKTYSITPLYSFDLTDAWYQSPIPSIVSRKPMLQVRLELTTSAWLGKHRLCGLVLLISTAR